MSHLASPSSTTTVATHVAGGTANDIPYQTAAGATGFITETANGILVYDSSGVPSSSTTAPSGVTYPAPIVTGRLRLAKGANVASAGDLALGSDGNYFIITGTTTINGIATANWNAGSEVTLEFSGAGVVAHSASPGAGYVALKLAESATFYATAGDTLTLRYNGTNWLEIGRGVLKGRDTQQKGADVASANDITLGNDGNFFVLTGTTQVNRFASQGWVAGSRFMIQWGAMTVTHNTASGGGYLALTLLHAVDAVMVAGDISEFIYNGTTFVEVRRISGRMLGLKGSDVASAGDMAVGAGTFFDVTGTTTINGIATSGWWSGATITLQFDASVTVTHNATPGAGYAKLLLAGAANLSATADDTLTLRYDGSVWREVSRAVI